MWRSICALLSPVFLLAFQAESRGQVEFRKPTWESINSSSSSQQPSAFDNDSRNTVLSQQDQSPSGSAQGNSEASGKTFGFASNAKRTLPQTIVTRQNVFGVPFSVNSDAGPIREVQLHVSTDQGKTWGLYSRQLPTAREFPFRANADGEYWFAVKTVGSKIPDEKLFPELVIAIDSRRPNFNVSLKTDALGRIVASWRAADENLDVKSIKLAYQSVPNWGGGQNQNWQEVRLPAPGREIQSVYEDEIAFYADTSNTSIDVRISIADRAGNVAMAVRRYNLPRTAAAPRNQPDRVANVAERVAPQGAVNPGPTSQGSASRPPSTDPYAAVTQQQKDHAASRVGIEAGFNRTLPAGSNDTHRPGAPIASSQSRQQGWHVQGGSAFQQDFHSNRPRENEFGNPNEGVPGSVSDPGFQNPSRLASSGRSVNETQEAFSRGSNINRIPSGQYAKLSSSRKFELDYQVEHIQPDDISKLEIWVTEDAGQNWKLKTTDPDRQSPVTIEVDDDGVYGYRIRIQTVDGLESVQPGRGDGADVWVEVDTTRPSVELSSIPYGRRSDAGKLIVNWRATDRRLAAKPITLYYSVNLDGPWQIIVEKLENTGQFKWPVTDRIPRSVYLRIEAVDAAGNKDFHQTDQPIDLSGLNPRGMIRGVRPIR